MKNIYNLTRILLKNNFAKTKIKSKLGQILLYLFIFIYIAGIMIYISFEAITALKIVNQQGLYITVCLFGIVMVSLIRSIFTSINVLYFSKDTEYILPFPINPKCILISKINILLLYEYIIEIFIGLIPMITFGILEGAGILYYIMMIIILILLPIVPILLSSFIVILIMKFTNIIKNKDFVQYISVAICMVFVIALQILIGGVNGEVTTNQIEEMVIKANGLIEMYSKNFITLDPVMKAIMNFNNIEGLKNIAIFILETILIYAIMIHISSKLYLKGLVGVSYGAKTKNKKNSNNSVNIKMSKTSTAYIKKEFKTLIKNPIYFMQCILPPILFPVIFSLPIYFSITGVNDMDLPEMSEMMSVVNTPNGIGIILCLIEFMFIFNFIALTAISRDGKNSIFMKYIPIPLYKQCIYKIVPSIILNFIPILYTIIVAIVLLKLNIISAICIFIISGLLNIFESYIMILVDLNRPKLEWTTEYAVVKQNFNMLYQMTFGTIAILGFAVFGNLIKNTIIITLIYSILFLICIYLVNRYIKNNEVKLFKKIVL